MTIRARQHGIIATTGYLHSVGSAEMASSVLYKKLIEAYLTAEIGALMKAKRWTTARFAAEIGKHPNTIRAWLNGERLPDTGNILRICDKTEADPVRRAFMEHVSEQLNQGPDLISDLDKRGLYIVESAERRYGKILKWDPLFLSGLVQTEAYHMERLAEPMEGAALKVKHWLRKERRQVDFYGRTDAPETAFLLPATAVRDLEHLGEQDRQQQIDRVLEIDAMPNCEVHVVEPPFEAIHAFDIFRSGGRPGAGPDFVYIETLDQSRHIVEAEKIALYDRFSSVMLDDAIRIGRFLDG
jgi:transcriptional regulator with XRE-family HTH domain